MLWLLIGLVFASYSTYKWARRESRESRRLTVLTLLRWARDIENRSVSWKERGAAEAAQMVHILTQVPSSGAKANLDPQRFTLGVTECRTLSLTALDLRDLSHFIDAETNGLHPLWLNGNSLQGADFPLSPCLFAAYPDTAKPRLTRREAREIKSLLYALDGLLKEDLIREVSIYVGGQPLREHNPLKRRYQITKSGIRYLEGAHIRGHAWLEVQR